MWYYPASALINALTLTILGIFVILKNRKSVTNLNYFVFCVFISFWSYSYFLWQISKTNKEAFFWCQMLMLGAIFIPAAYFNFITSLINKHTDKTLKKIVYLGYLLAGVFAILNFTPLMIIDVKPKLKFPFWPTAGIAYKYFLLYFLAYAIYGCYLLLKEARNADGNKRNQYFYVFIGSAIGYLGGATNFPLWYDIKLYPFGNILSSIYVALVAYAIVKYRLLDIRIALTRAGVFIIVYTLVLGIPFGLVGWGKDWLIYFLGQNWYWAPMLLLLGLATCGPFTYIYLSRKAEERFLKEERHAHQLLKQASQGMVRIHDKRRLLELIVHITTKILGLSNAAVFLLDENSGNFKLAAARFKNKYQYSEVIPQDDPLVQLLATKKEPLVYEELKLANQDLSSDTPNQLKEIDPQMRKLKAAVIIPAVSNARLLAFLVLSEKKSKKMYSPEDLSTLWALSYEAALAIDNAFLYEKEKLRLAEQSRRQALADMAPGASHQFNNRLATISATTDNLLDLVKNDSQEAYQDNLLSNILEGLEIIQKEVAKGEQITKAILQKAKVKLEFDKVDIVKVIQNALNLIRIRRTRESLGGAKEPEFVFNYPKDLPLLTLCEGTIQDVFENMFNNSYDAIVIKHKRHIAPLDYQGKISVDVTRNDNSVIIQVEDNGIGIQKDNLRKLFTDFFTTKATSEKGVVGGSGLGLGVMRSFIEEHGGTITAESEYTQWTRFTITLPLNFKPPK